jgi:hypothetical protein
MEVLPENPGVPTINARKHRRWGPWWMLSEIQEHPPSMLKMSMMGLLAGADGDPGAPTISVKNVDGGPPGGC